MLKRKAEEMLNGGSSQVMQLVEELGHLAQQVAPDTHEELSGEAATKHDHLDSKHAKMKIDWEDAAHRYTNRTDGYARVGVLIVQWAGSLDDLDTATSGEVEELKAIFEVDFGYQVEVLELSTKKKPQGQLVAKIAQFVNEYDDLDVKNLVIVYYTGHGVWEDKRRLLHFEANRYWKKQELTHSPQACWNAAETPLLDAGCDCLAILDCCFASNLMKKSGHIQGPKSYELLVASHIGEVTEPPGTGSFTKALVDSLKEFRDEGGALSFTTFQLHRKIMERREGNPPNLFHRLQDGNRHIRLERPVTVSEAPKFDASETYLLHMRFELTKGFLETDEIVELAKGFPRVFREAGIDMRHADWVALRQRSHFLDKWRKVKRANDAKTQFLYDPNRNANHVEE